MWHYNFGESWSYHIIYNWKSTWFKVIIWIFIIRSKGYKFSRAWIDDNDGIIWNRYKNYIKNNNISRRAKSHLWSIYSLLVFNFLLFYGIKILSLYFLPRLSLYWVGAFTCRTMLRQRNNLFSSSRVYFSNWQCNCYNWFHLFYF